MRQGKTIRLRAHGNNHMLDPFETKDGPIVPADRCAVPSPVIERYTGDDADVLRIQPARA